MLMIGVIDNISIINKILIVALRMQSLFKHMIGATKELMDSSKKSASFVFFSLFQLPLLHLVNNKGCTILWEWCLTDGSYNPLLSSQHCTCSSTELYSTFPIYIINVSIHIHQGQETKKKNLKRRNKNL